MEKQIAHEQEKEMLMQQAKAVGALPVLGWCSVAALVRNGKRQLRNVRQVRWRLTEWEGKEFQTAVEWLLDNWYLVQQEGTSGIDSLRRAGKLRETVDSQERRMPLLCALADAWLESDVSLTSENFIIFLEEVQKNLPLSEKELALFLQVVRLRMLEQLNYWCDELEHACILWEKRKQRILIPKS